MNICFLIFNNMNMHSAKILTRNVCVPNQHIKMLIVILLFLQCVQFKLIKHHINI